MTAGTIRNPDRLAAAIVAGFLVARLVFAILLGPGVDESYTLAISRTLALSYFDHPPLHQWIAHAAARGFGEGLGARLPFILMFAATGWIYYRTTAGLFGPRAGIVALFALNAAPFFFASAGTWIVPDGPLLFGLAAAAWALARLFFGGPAGGPGDAQIKAPHERRSAPHASSPLVGEERGGGSRRTETLASDAAKLRGPRDPPPCPAPTRGAGTLPSARSAAGNESCTYRSEGRATVWALWLAAGVALGLAGLSKYSAALTALGLFAFVVLSPRRRRWLADPAPWVAAAVALAMIAPVVVWNARHGWVSFGFQGARGAAGAGLKPAQVAAMVLGEVAYLSPWLAAPLLASLVAAWRKRADDRRLFLLCLALPPIVVFTLTPLWGARGLPHWAMPGWFFVFALMGAWVEDRGVTGRTLRRWAFASAGLLAAVAGLVSLEAATGWPLRLLAPSTAARDPTLEAYDWGALRDATAMRAKPAFVLAARWSDAGKIALALGPGTPVFVISSDPRGWAFVEGGDGLADRDGALVARAQDLAAAEAEAAPIARSLGAPQAFALTRNGEPAVELSVVPVHGLTRALPLPYPGAPGG